MARDVPGAVCPVQPWFIILLIFLLQTLKSPHKLTVSEKQWPQFMLQVQEIRKAPNVRDRYIAGTWFPPQQHQQLGARINRRLFWCDANTINRVEGRLNEQYDPLPAFSIYHHQREIFALEGDVLNGDGALGPTFEDTDSEDEVEDQAWMRINFEHEAGSSFVGIAGDHNFLNAHNHGATWARRLIPRTYHADERRTGQSGLNGNIQLLLGLLRLCEDQQTERFTATSSMNGGRWRMRRDAPARPNHRGIVVRVWALPGGSAEALEGFGGGSAQNVFS